MPDRPAIEAVRSLPETAKHSANVYDRRTEHLNDVLRPILEEASLHGAEGESIARVLRLSLLEQILEGESTDRVCSDARRLLHRLRGANIADERDEEGNDGGALLQALELEATHRARADDKVYEVRRSDFARTLDGNSSASTRHVLQALFNEPRMRPRVLVAQSRVGAEGLNLHEACRHVLMLHLDWNPAVIEQQVGRVDRLQSLWSREFKARVAGRDLPHIEIATVVLEGTSDAEKRDRIVARQRLLDAHVFGDLVSPGVLEELPPDWAERIRAAAPNFSPSGHQRGSTPAAPPWAGA
jgi:hypothetical protein